MKKDANVTLPPNVTLPASNDPRATSEDLKRINGAVLFGLKPELFDSRYSDQQRFSQITSRQHEEYLGELKCALCGVPGGRCNCKPK